MKLNTVRIRNFRSVDDVLIEFNPQCRVLVGTNESGKSNILKALSCLGDFQPSAKDDVREPLPDEAPIVDSYIQFNFSLSKAETDGLLKLVSANVLVADPQSTPIAKRGDLNLTLRSFIESRNQGVYNVDVLAETKTFAYWQIDENYEIVPGWERPSETCPADFKIDIQSGDKRILKSVALIYRPDLLEVPCDYTTAATVADLAAVVGNTVTQIMEENLPETLFWIYSDANLLPGSINIDAFARDPATCLPLKRMFDLAGIYDIGKAIEDARGKSRNSFNNFFESIARKSTEHFQSVWKERKTLAFDLSPDGDDLIPSVREHNRYDFAKRSDGFKRFATFLLLISAAVKNGTLRNAVLLIDEPDLSLHPSGARFLRDELIKIAKTNYVIYSTHSIFMIDSEDVSRHIIVTKTDERTSVEVAGDSNFVDEEVIYNALGYSIFEILNQKNIIFEGWKDKRLFQVATKRLPASHSALKEVLKGLGVCHAKGVSHVKSITPIIELTRRDCLIISDGDAPAKQRQKEYTELGGYGTWKRYDEILTTVPITTGEDFIKVEAFLAPIREVKSRFSALADFDEERMTTPLGKLHALEDWLKIGGLDQQTRKSEIKKIKDRVFEKLKVSEIEEYYFDFLARLTTLIQA